MSVKQNALCASLIKIEAQNDTVAIQNIYFTLKLSTLLNMHLIKQYVT